MCFRLLYTVSRGRSAGPDSFRRMRAFLFSRGSMLDMSSSIRPAGMGTSPAGCVGGSGQPLGGAGLPFLPPDALVVVLDALALVRLGRTERTDLHRGLPQRLPVHAPQREPDGGQCVLGPRHLVHLGGHSLGPAEDDGMAEPPGAGGLLALPPCPATHAPDVALALP